ncbi:MAG: hypothetical protein ACPGPE_08970 [Planctomycetota bacterium]
MFPTLHQSVLPRAFALAASTPLLASLAQGQVNAPPVATRGMLMTVPCGFLAADASGQQDLRVSQPGSQPLPSLPWSPSTFVTGSADNPDYSPAAVVSGLEASGVVWLGAAAIPTLELSGISTGNDMFPYAGPDGVITPGTGSMGWWACSVTVGGTDAPSFGEPSNATWSSLAEPKKSVVTYYPGTNTGLSSSFVDALYVENLPHEWGIDGAAFSDVLGLDLGIGVVSFDPANSRSAPFVSDRSQLFFSLSPGSAAEWFASSQLAHAVTNVSFPLGPLDPAAIYRLNWTQGPSGWGWSNLEVAFSREDLFGAALSNATDLEIDGLSVYWNVAQSRRDVVVSTAPFENNSGEIQYHVDDELMVFSHLWSNINPVSAQVAEVTTTTGTEPLAKQLGLRRRGGGTGSDERDNVNGVCLKDPAWDSTAPSPSRGVGVVLDPSVTESTCLGISASRFPMDPVARTGDAFRIQVSGLVEAPFLVLEYGFNALGAHSGDSAFGWHFDPALVQVMADSELPGTFEIPAPPGSLGLSLLFRARQVDMSGQTLAVSPSAVLRF